MGEYLKARFRDVVRTAHEIGMQLDLYFCSPMKKEIDEGSVDMRGKYEETMEFIGKASPVSLAG